MAGRDVDGRSRDAETPTSGGERGQLDRRVKKKLMARLEADALRICRRFELRYRVLEAERANVKSRYGVCFSDGTVRIRLRHATTGKPLKYSSLVNTLCHELAHLKHFNHGPRFQSLYGRILEWARHEGIYCPATASAAGKVQAGRSPSVSAVAARGSLPSPPRKPAGPTRLEPPPAVQLELFS